MATTTRTDQNIIAAAVKLWRQAHNINSVSLEDIAREAGAPSSAVRDIFGTREKLTQEVIKHLMGDILEKQKAILKSDMPFPRKMQGMISAKMQPIKGMEVDLLDKICTDPASRQYVEEMTQAEFRPMMKAIIGEGKREGYIRADMPDEVIMLYFDVLKSGGVACTGEMKRIVADRDTMLAYTRLIYFGLFQKEFDISFDGAEEQW